MKNEENRQEFILNAIVFIAMAISYGFMLISFVKTHDHFSLNCNGIPYMTLCMVECIRFIFKEMKICEDVVLINVVKGTLVICLTYIIIDALWLFAGSSIILGLFSLLVMISYPVKTFFLTMYYYKLSK